MSTSIFFAGRVISVPGAYSNVDASGLEQVGLGASGIVALLGTAEGGVPVSALSKAKDIPRFKNPDKVRKYLRSGDLLEGAAMAFEPAKDNDILAGAQEVLLLKTNAATQAEATLQKSGVDCIDLASVDYGAFTDQINVELAAGTNKGKLLTITFEGTTETVDDLGGDTLATLNYNGGTTGYNTAVMDVNDDGDITVTATRTGTGGASLIDNAATNAAIEVLSGNAGDVGQIVHIFGLVGGVATHVQATLNGTTVVPVTGTVWDAGGVLGVYIEGTATLGTVTVRTLGGAGVNIFTVPAGTSAEGVIKCDYCYVDKTTLSAAVDAAAAVNVLYFGRNAANGSLAEKIVTNGTTPVVSATSTYAFIDYIVVGALAAARTLTVTARAARSLASVQKTLQKAADYFNAKSAVIAGPTTRGFVFTLETGKVNFLTSDLDVQSSVNVKATDGDLTADLYAIVAWINANSALVTAEVSATATSMGAKDTLRASR